LAPTPPRASTPTHARPPCRTGRNRPSTRDNPRGRRNRCPPAHRRTPPHEPCAGTPSHVEPDRKRRSSPLPLFTCHVACPMRHARKEAPSSGPVAGQIVLLPTSRRTSAELAGGTSRSSPMTAVTWCYYSAQQRNVIDRLLAGQDCRGGYENGSTLDRTGSPRPACRHADEHSRLRRAPGGQ